MKLTFNLKKDTVNLFYESGIIDVELCIPFVAGRLLRIPAILDQSEELNEFAPRRVKLEVSTGNPKKKGWVKVENTKGDFCVSGKRIPYPGILLGVKRYMTENGLRHNGTFCLWLKATQIS